MNCWHISLAKIDRKYKEETQRREKYVFNEDEKYIPNLWHKLSISKWLCCKRFLRSTNIELCSKSAQSSECRRNSYKQKIIRSGSKHRVQILE